MIRRSRPPRIPGGPAEERLRATAGATDPLGLAVRTAAAVEAVPSRRHSRWLHRQLRHGTPAWVPAGDLPLLENLTGRAWCTLGSLTGHRAHVDPAGLVAPDHGHWSVDWLVGAGDRWLVPAHDPSVRQRRVGPGPVVETRLRTPRGDVVHTVAVASSGSGAVAVIEVANETDVPVTLALVLQPAGLLGVGTVGQLSVAGRAVSVDGRPALVCDAEPRALAFAHGGADVAEVVTSGDAFRGDGSVTCGLGLAEGAIVLPLTHRTSRRFTVALDGATAPPDPSSVPPPPAVASGWEPVVAAAARVELPDPLLHAAVGRAVADLVVAGSARGEPPLGRRHDWAVADSARSAAELARWGRSAEAVAVLGGLLDARIADAASTVDLVAVLAAAGETWQVTHDASFAGELGDELTAFVARALRRLGRERAPAVASREVRALDALPGALEAAGQPDLATVAAERLATFAGAVAPELPAPPAGGELLVGDHTGLHPAATARAAAAEIAAGDLTGVSRLLALVRVGGETGCLPTRMDPRSGSGSAGSGHDPAATAELAAAIRCLLAVDDRDGIRLLPAYPDDWLGQGVEVHGLPTPFGALSYAVRWHGERPALLWEVTEPARGAGAGRFEVTAPGLDPAWSSTERDGEALLGPVHPVGRAPDGPG